MRNVGTVAKADMVLQQKQNDASGRAKLPILINMRYSSCLKLKASKRRVLVFSVGTKVFSYAK